MAASQDHVEGSESRMDEKAAQVNVSLAADDPSNPHNWPLAQRWLVVVACSSMGMISILAPSMIIPAAPQLLQSFDLHDDLYRTLLVTIWELGEGVSPFLAGPLSEIFGRAPIYHGGNILGVVTIIASALSTNISMLIAFRFLSGFFLTAPTLVPAIIGDVIRPSERGVAMAFGEGLQIVAPFVAPIAGSYINQALGWRWVLWILSILVGTLTLFSLLVVRETYAPKIEESKSKAGHLPEDAAEHALEAKEKSKAAVGKVTTRMMRPLQLLFTTPLVLLISIYTGLVGAIQYTIITTLTEIMESRYGFSRGNVGLAYIAPSIGFAIGVLFYGLTSDRYLKYQKRRHGSSDPKDRLVHAILGSCILPLGLIFYGWMLKYQLPWIVPLIGSAFIGLSFILTILPTMNYLVDAFEPHGASAVAACRIVTSVFAAAFPLCGPGLYKRLGYGWGNSLLALICAVFIPLLWLLLRVKRSPRSSADSSSPDRRRSSATQEPEKVG